MTRVAIALALLALGPACALEDAGTATPSTASATGGGGTSATGGDGGHGGGASTVATTTAASTTTGAGGDGGGGTSAQGGGDPGPTCGDGTIDPGEECDGPAPCDTCLMRCPPSWTKGATGTCYGAAESEGEGQEVVDRCAATRDQVAIDEAVILRPATPDVPADLETVVAVCGDDVRGDGCWIGADDLRREGTYTWASGEDFTYVPGEAPWGDGEGVSEGAEYEDCLEVFAPEDDQATRPLADDDCDDDRRIVCEIVPPGL